MKKRQDKAKKFKSLEKLHTAKELEARKLEVQV